MERTRFVLRAAAALTAASVAFAFDSSARADDAQSQSHAWGGAFLTGPIASKLRWYLEGHLRLSDDPRANPGGARGFGPFAELLRPALYWEHSPSFGIYAGFAWIWAQTPPGTRLELRPWQQLFVHHSVGPLRLSHRPRLEQRFLADGAFALRFRYFLRVAGPLAGPVWLGTMQELFVQRLAGAPVFDQHRAFFGPSFTYGKKGSRLDVGYQLIVLNTGGPPLRLGHAFAVYLFHNF